MVSVNDINMAVYTFVQPLFSNRDSYVTLNRITLVFLLYLFLTTGIDQIFFFGNFFFNLYEYRDFLDMYVLVLYTQLENRM